jgi:hypothetical protein
VGEVEGSLHFGPSFHFHNLQALNPPVVNHLHRHALNSPGSNGNETVQAIRLDQLRINLRLQIARQPGPAFVLSRHGKEDLPRIQTGPCGFVVAYRFFSAGTVAIWSSGMKSVG